MLIGRRTKSIFYIGRYDQYTILCVLPINSSPFTVAEWSVIQPAEIALLTIIAQSDPSPRWETKSIGLPSSASGLLFDHRRFLVEILGRNEDLTKIRGFQ